MLKSWFLSHLFQCRYWRHHWTMSTSIMASWDFSVLWYKATRPIWPFLNLYYFSIQSGIFGEPRDLLDIRNVKRRNLKDDRGSDYYIRLLDRVPIPDLLPHSRPELCWNVEFIRILVSGVRPCLCNSNGACHFGEGCSDGGCEHDKCIIDIEELLETSRWILES